MAMKIALFTAAFSSYPIERAFEAAAKYGYDGIEIDQEGDDGVYRH